jgi:hypothetical protein
LVLTPAQEQTLVDAVLDVMLSRGLNADEGDAKAVIELINEYRGIFLLGISERQR